MSAIQLNFSIRTSSKCKTVHLVGSWDNYKSDLPLGKDGGKSGGWRGTFRFKQPALMPGGRYWYYYIIDGFQVCHDPTRDHTVEPTTSRKLNVLDVPVGSGHSSHLSGHGDFTWHGHVPRQMISGRSLSPSQIQHPLPSRPYETKLFYDDNLSGRDIEALARKYASQRLVDSDDSSDSGASTDRSSRPRRRHHSSRSSGSSSPSSVSSLDSPLTPASPSGSPDIPCMSHSGHNFRVTYASPGEDAACVCERWALMSSGEKIRLDCGGAVCRSSSGSEGGCDSSSEEERRMERVRQAGGRAGGRHHHRSGHHKTSSKKSSRSKR